MEGRILSASRRRVTILDSNGKIIDGTVSSRALDVAAGDHIQYEFRGEAVFVLSLIPAKRCLYRSQRNVAYRIGANIDLLFLVTAVGDVFNTVAIDRVLVAASSQQIPVALVVNKADLGTSTISEFLEVYQSLPVTVLLCSAKTTEGFEHIKLRIDAPLINTVAFTGISGVGKSSLIKLLVPHESIQTGAVNERTGQGRQTTSQARGYPYENSDNPSCLIIDFPGIQSFGLSHIATADVVDAYPDIKEAAQGCRFDDCGHVREQQCGVKDALASGTLRQWRFRSYLEILAEIKALLPY